MSTPCPFCGQPDRPCWVCAPDPDLAAAVDAVLTPSTCQHNDPRDCPHDACWVRPVACRGGDRTASEESK